MYIMWIVTRQGLSTSLMAVMLELIEDRTLPSAEINDAEEPTPFDDVFVVVVVVLVTILELWVHLPVLEVLCDLIRPMKIQRATPIGMYIMWIVTRQGLSTSLMTAMLWWWWCW
jgi:cellobiose-specific phosphotransferase system component IIB